MFTLGFQIADLLAKASGLGGLGGALQTSTKALGLGDGTTLSANGKAALAAILGTAALGTTAVIGAAHQLSHTRITIRENPPTTGEQLKEILGNRQVQQIGGIIALGALLAGSQLLLSKAGEDAVSRHKLETPLIFPYGFGDAGAIGGTPTLPGAPSAPPAGGGGAGGVLVIR